jgi:malate synthase
VNEIALRKVREDKLRESGDGFDGTWVAHPDLVPVAMEVFDRVLGDKPHQKKRLREEVSVTAEELIDFCVPGGEITEAGLRQNINVGLQYIESWLRGIGAAAIYNLMEDVATAEISRAQVWQWVHNPDAVMKEGEPVSPATVRQMIPEELGRIRDLYGEEVFASGKFDLASQIFELLVLSDEFIPFLTLAAYQYLD